MERAERFIAHALVELRKRRWWPFGVRSAVLLDVSSGGFKIELTGKSPCAIGDLLLMTIPLSPFGIVAPEAISLNVEIKWFDHEKMRCGGVFTNKDSASVLFLEKIIDASEGLAK